MTRTSVFWDGGIADQARLVGREGHR